MDSADVSDISNSPAYQSLDELVGSGKLTQAQSQLYRSKYAKLHEVVLKTYENEKNLLKKAKLLNQDLTAEKGKLEKTAARAQEDSEVCSSSSSALAAAAVPAAVASALASTALAVATLAAAADPTAALATPLAAIPDPDPGPLHSSDPGPDLNLTHSWP